MMREELFGKSFSRTLFKNSYKKVFVSNFYYLFALLFGKHFELRGARTDMVGNVCNNIVGFFHHPFIPIGDRKPFGDGFKPLRKNSLTVHSAILFRQISKNDVKLDRIACGKFFEHSYYHCVKATVIADIKPLYAMIFNQIKESRPQGRLNFFCVINLSVPEKSTNHRKHPK